MPKLPATLPEDELLRRIKLFQGRAPLRIKRRTPPLEAALVAYFDGDANKDALSGLDPWEREMLAAARKSWRRIGAEPVKASLFRRVFDALPTPMAVVDDEGVLWNRAFVAQLEAVGCKGTGCACIAVLMAMVRASERLRSPALYWALAERLFRVNVVAFSQAGSRAAYFFPDHRSLPELPLEEQQVLAMRLSGLSLKQIAWLLSTGPARVEGISKRNRRHLMRLRSEACLEPAV